MFSICIVQTYLCRKHYDEPTTVYHTKKQSKRVVDKDDIYSPTSYPASCAISRKEVTRMARALDNI